jgi:toxin ParE1/3/4
MPKPIISELAELDLDREWKYIAQYSIDAADELVEKVLSSSEIHAGQPLLGRDRSDLGPGIRSFIVGKHIVLFRPEANTVRILRLIYGARDIPRLMQEDN